MRAFATVKGQVASVTFLLSQVNRAATALFSGFMSRIQRLWCKVSSRVLRKSSDLGSSSHKRLHSPSLKEVNDWHSIYAEIRANDTIPKELIPVQHGIHVEDLSKSYVNSSGGELKVLSDIEFYVDQGEFVSIFGPNGCGKSTLLSIVGGLIPDFEGTVEVFSNPPNARGVGYVFQDFNASLFPWMTVIDNVAFGLKMLEVNKQERHSRAMEWLRKFDLAEFANVYPYQISGGMKQKACIARALVGEYKVLLFDEPFSALDYNTMQRVHADFLNLWQAEPKTTLFVSHDVDEAVLLSDRILVLSERPARVIKVINDNLTRPRNNDMLTNPAFISIRNELIQLIQKTF